MGYFWEGMQKISYEEALKRYRNNEEVYLLYWDNAEGLAESEEDIHEHNKSGAEFGYEL